MDPFEYHSCAPGPGKVFSTTKPVKNREELALAYTPGVAKVCQAIQSDVTNAKKYTNIQNRVLVISDGTATLGLGNTGPLASKPVMEGKAALMKTLANIDAIDLVCKPEDIESTVKAVAMNFGAINIEDVAAPRCFELMENLERDLDIPVFHDDQYGTAVVVCAALRKALNRVKKTIANIKIVISGAGAGAQATALLLMECGVQKHQIWMFDSKGLITSNRAVDKYKARFAQDSDNLTYADALKGADVFIGLSRANVLQPKDIGSMEENPIIFALANPDPEIDINTAKEIREDGFYATASSNDPNQINNVLCFPFLFRRILDKKIKKVTKKLLLEYTQFLASLKSSDLLPEVFDKRLISEEEWWKW